MEIFARGSYGSVLNSLRNSAFMMSNDPMGTNFTSSQRCKEHPDSIINQTEELLARLGLVVKYNNNC